MSNNSLNTFPNSRYGPYGYNDNNQGRQRVPSNIFPPHGGMRGNEAGRFNQLTTNTQNLMKNLPSMSNFNKAYQPNTQMIEPINYVNQNNLIHNNVSDHVLDEHVVEYRINIDSLDRDISVYRDPFKFTVKFNPSSNSIYHTKVRTNSKNNKKETKLVESLLKGSPRPHINKEFKNVKYVKLDSVILPQYSGIKEVDGEYVFDKSKFLVDDRFVVLRIKELDDDKGIRVYDTGDGSIRVDDNGSSHPYPKPFGIIFPDKLLGRNYYTGTPYHASKIYRNSTLGNITQLTIEFFDSCGAPIRIDDLFDNVKLDKCSEEGNELPTSDLRHPLNKKIQVHLSLIIGVVEGQINTNTKFEH